jgi:hypothetical protein
MGDAKSESAVPLDRRCARCGETHDLVTVCEACKHASCWLGAFMCEGSLSAGAVALTIGALVLLRERGETHESPSYWKPERAHG